MRHCDKMACMRNFNAKMRAKFVIMLRKNFRS